MDGGGTARANMSGVRDCTTLAFTAAVSWNPQGLPATWTVPGEVHQEVVGCQVRGAFLKFPAASQTGWGLE